MHLRLDERPFSTVPPAVANGAYQPVSFWQETVDVTPGVPLAEDLDCDVVIAGGGYTGLSVAYHLKQQKPDLDIVILERSVVGHGASGRNGGFAMPLIGWDLYHAASALGEETAGAAYRLMYQAVDHLKQVVAEHQIACDLEATGYILINTCTAREKRARRELELAHRLGFDHTWLDRDALQDYIRCDQYRSGVLDPHPCIINPAKLARGLKAVVEGMGVRIYEQTSINEIVDGAPVQVRTPGGIVRGTQAVLALNGFSGALGFMKSRILPVHTYIVLTEPLSDAQLEAIGWAKHRASLETARNFIHYFRLTADNRIAFGGEDAELYPGGSFRNEDPGIFEALKARFRQYFPTLRDLQFTHAWGGTLGVSVDMFPTFGQGGSAKNIFHACAYAGHGVSLSNYAGAILAPEMLRAAGHNAEAHPGKPFFYNRIPFWLPPDPLRYLGMRGYRALLRAHDRIQGA